MALSSVNAYHPDTPRAYFRGIYYETIDSVVSAVETRFNQPSYHPCEVMENLLLKMVNKEDTSDEQDFIKTRYADDIDTTQLQIEADALPVMFHNEKPECFNDIITQMKKLPRHQLLLIPNIITICKLRTVNPATIATAERSFSTARGIKAWISSTVVPSIFNSLAILHGQKRLSDELVKFS